jgi:hypothetical protein
LTTAVRPEAPYLIQYRSFVPSVVSAFEVYVRSGRPDTKDSFYFFSMDNAERYKAFLNKWVIDPDAPSDRLIVPYEILTSRDNIECLKDVISFFEPDKPADACRLDVVSKTMEKVTVESGRRRIYRDFGIRNSRRLEDFRFFEEGLFEELANMTRETEIRAARMER